VEGGATIRYDWAPLRSLLVMVTSTDQHYLNNIYGQPSEDSTGYQTLFGIDYDDNAVWRYRVLLGVETRHFAAYRAHTDFVTEMDATWSPSGLTTVRGSLTRTIEDAAQEGVAGFTYTAVRFTIDHEYLRNLLVSASAGLQRADFLRGGGGQNAHAAGAGITWLVNRSMRLSATYDLTGVAKFGTVTTNLGDNYARQIALITLRLAL
jgi:hypothetical protein